MALVGGALLLADVPNSSISGMAFSISIVVPFLNMTKQFAGSIGQVSNQINMVIMGLAGAHRIFAPVSYTHLDVYKRQNWMVQGAFAATAWGWAGSWISTGLSMISAMRPAETEARGMMTKTREIIIKLMMICKAYCIKAIMLPTSATLLADLSLIHI